MRGGRLIAGAEVADWAPGGGFRKLIAGLVKEHGVAKLGFEERYMSVASHTEWLVEGENVLLKHRYIKSGFNGTGSVRSKPP